MTQPNSRAHLISILKDFDTGILVTHTAEGGIRGRPMAMAETRDDGELVFAAGLDSPKLKEIARDAHVGMMFQGKTKWVSVSGNARIILERDEIHRLWKDSWKLWFPEGKDDPNLCLLAIDPTEGEYWDNSGARGIRFAIEALRAAVTGTKPDDQKMDEHAKVKL